MLLFTGIRHEIYFISANSPGSLHDSDVLHSSNLFVKLQAECWRPFPGCVILGDSGYPGLYPFLATPYLPGVAKTDVRKKQYNDAFVPARSNVERTIGIFKAKFQSLKSGLRLQEPVQCTRVIEILAAMHNFVIRANNPEDDLDPAEMEEIERQIREKAWLNDQPAINVGNSVQTRDRILANYF